MTAPSAIGGAIGGATGVSSGLSRLASADNLEKAGQQFEAMVTGLMLKAMRQAKLADPLFDSKAIDTFTEMSDAKVAQAMAAHQPLGIGKALTEFLKKNQAAAPPDKADKADLNPGGASASP